MSINHYPLHSYNMYVFTTSNAPDTLLDIKDIKMNSNSYYPWGTNSLVKIEMVKIKEVPNSRMFKTL